MKYADCIQHKTAASAGEIGWNIAGTAGGGLLGFLLSRIAHKRRSGLRDLLYALAGAGAGVAGVNYAMDRTPDNGGPTWRERLRNADVTMPDLLKRTQEQERKEQGSHTMANLLGLGGGIWGGIQGARGKGVDFSGRSTANSILNTMMNAAPNKEELRTDATKRFAQAGGNSVPRLNGFKEKLRNPFEARRQRALDILQKGDVVATDKGWKINSNIKDQRLANAGRVATDIAGNAALHAALLYSAGRIGGAIKSGIGANTNDIQAAARSML